MAEQENWWNRPAGVREVMQVALPLVISSLSWTVMTFVDRMMLFWDSGDAMTAAFNASIMWFASLCLPLGICAFTNTFVAQYFGSRKFDGVGRSAWQGIWIALLFTPICVAFGMLAPSLFYLAGHEPAVAALEETYFRILVWGSGGILVSQSASAFFGGQGRTSVMMWVDAAFAMLNLVLDYCWIFGYAGFPAMGIAGAGYATVLSLWLKAAFYLWLMLRPAEHARFETRTNWRPDWSLIMRMLRYGGPAGLQMMIDVAGFTTFVMLVGRLGTVSAEATSMAFSISSFAFMPVFGFGQAAGILVGQHLGENREGLAARSAWNSVLIGMVYMAVISAMYVLVPDLFLWGFFSTGEVQGEHATEVRALAIVLLQFVAAYNIFDAALTIFSGALKGAGDTTFILGISLVLGLVLAGITWLAVIQLSADVIACWQIVTAWIWVGGVVYAMRFMAGKWKKMRVIEQG